MKGLLKLLVVVLATGLVFGCGSGSRNDEGTSFVLFGFFRVDPDSGEKAGDAGRRLTVASLSGDSIVSSLSQETIYIGTNNNLTGQYIRLRKAHFSFEAVGANVSIPPAEIKLGGILAPIQNATDEEGGGTSLPDPVIGIGEGAGTTNYYQTLLFPPPVTQWFKDNGGQLPRTPFQLIVTISVEGVTSAGDTITTNEEYYPVYVFPIGGSASDGDGGLGGDSTDVTVTTATTTTVVATTTTTVP